MFPILVLLFTVVPAIEIFLLFKIGGEIGGINTLFVIISTGIIGASLAKSQGLQILMKIQESTQRGEVPGSQIIQGLMVFAGGLLLLTPGFLTDIFGFSLVMPGTRHLLMIWVKKMIEKGMKSGNMNFQSFGQGGRGGAQYTYTSSQNGTSQNPFERFNQTQNHVEKNDEIAPGVFEAEFKKHDDE
jgi:UPF0716 protein FxsA